MYVCIYLSIYIYIYMYIYRQREALCVFGEGSSLALVGLPYGVDVLHRPASHPIYSYWVG